MDASLPSTSAMAANYENGQTSNVDPMDLTIGETMEKLNGIRQEVSDMGSKITYLREIRGRALALLAQADAAEEEASRLEVEQSNLGKEVERLLSVVMRMEDMRYSTKQLTDQMQLDTALQMRHILENGKSIVPRVPPNTRIKRTHSEDNSADPSQPLFKMPRRDTTDMASGSGPTTNGLGLSRPGSASSPNTGSMNKYSPNRALSLTPGSLASLAALAGGEPRALTQPFLDLSGLPGSQVGSQNASLSPPVSGPVSGSTGTNSSSAAGQSQYGSSPVSLFSHAGGNGGGNGILYHHPPPSNLFSSSSTSSSSSAVLSHAAGSDDAGDVEMLGGMDLLYR